MSKNLRYRIVLETEHEGGEEYYRWWLEHISRAVPKNIVDEIKKYNVATLKNIDHENGTRHTTTYKVFKEAIE